MPNRLSDRIRDVQERLAELLRDAEQMEAEMDEVSALVSGLTRRFERAAAAMAATRTTPPTTSAPPPTQWTTEPSRPATPTSRTSRRRPIRHGSSVDWTKRALETHMRPLTLDEVIAWASTRGKADIKKATLMSNLSRYVASQDTFERVAPSTFALIEWDRGAVYDPGADTEGRDTH